MNNISNERKFDLVFVFLISCFICFSCSSNSEQTKAIDFKSFQITVPESWNMIEMDGFDSQIGGIVIDQTDTLIFDYGYYPDDLQHDADLNEYENAEIDGFRANIVKPKKSGNGITGLYIDSLSVDTLEVGSDPTGMWPEFLVMTNKFQISGYNLQPRNEQLFLEAIKTIEFKIEWKFAPLTSALTRIRRWSDKHYTLLLLRARSLYSFNMKHQLILYIICLLAVSCQKEVHINIKGFYTGGWEWSQFEPCNNLDEWWWVTGDTVFLNKYDSLARANGHNIHIGPYVFLEVQGIKSQEGTYGHLDDYVREFEITRVDSIEYQKDVQMGDRKIKEKICKEK